MSLDSPPPLVPPTKTCNLAVWSLVLGCVGLVLLLVCIGPLVAIPAVICGHLAYNRIKRSGGALSGEGIALAGIIAGYVNIGLSVILIPLMAAIALPNFVKARQTAQRNFCVNNLRMIESAKQSWALEKQKTLQEAPTVEELKPYLGKDFSVLKCPAGGTYSINQVGESPSCSIPTHRLPASPALER
jgi:competence protein ComGC